MRALIAAAVLFWAAAASAETFPVTEKPWPLLPNYLVEDLIRTNGAARSGSSVVVRYKNGPTLWYRPLEDFEKIGTSALLKRSNYYAVYAVEPQVVTKTVMKTVNVPEIRYQTRYVDRIVEKPVYVEKPVIQYVERIVEKPVPRDVEKPVFIDRPLPIDKGVSPAFLAAIFVAGMLACLLSYRAGRRKYRLSLPELEAMSRQAREMAARHAAYIRSKTTNPR